MGATVQVASICTTGHINEPIGPRRPFKSLTGWLEIPAGVAAQWMGHRPSATADRRYTVRPSTCCGFIISASKPGFLTSSVGGRREVPDSEASAGHVV